MRQLLRVGILVLSMLVIAQGKASSQSLKPNEWRTYTSMRSIRAMAVASDSVHLWAASGGGAFRISLRDPNEPLLALRTTDGLSENDLTAVACDADGNAYFGSFTGAFDVVRNGSTQAERLGSEIQASGFTTRKVNSITIFGDTAFLAMGYGLEIYRLSRGYFAATAAQIGSSGVRGSDSVRQVAVVDGYIYAALHRGLAYAPLRADLATPSVWTILPDTAPVESVVVFHGSVYVGAADGISVVAPDRSRLIPTGFVDDVTLLAPSKDSLYAMDRGGNIYTSGNLTTFNRLAWQNQVKDIASTLSPAPYVGFVIGTSSSGLAYLAGSQVTERIFPPGPVSNSVPIAANLDFSSTTDQLYVSNGLDGLSSFKPSTGEWTDYDRFDGVTPYATYRQVSYDSVRRITWVATGGSLFVFKNFGSPVPSIDTIDIAHCGLPIMYPGAPNYFIGGNPIIDRSGHLVIPCWGVDGHGLAILNDGPGYHFTSYKIFDAWAPWGCVTQDMEGNYWVGSLFGEPNPPPSGVSWLRASDHVYGNVAGGANELLPHNAVDALLTDQDDGIWCGTLNGLVIISNPYSIANSNQQLSRRPVQLLTSQSVHNIVVDGVGNKWIGTDNGIFVVSPDGSDSIARFTKSNSPLIDNQIDGLAIDVVRGEVYAGTPSGISRFSTILKQGNPDYAKIRVFPNPVVQNSEGSPTVYVDGLVAGSTVKVFTIGRRLVRTINGANLGSTVAWNGLDDLGQLVPSGEYLITATSPQSGDNGEAKVVIVRK